MVRVGPGGGGRYRPFCVYVGGCVGSGAYSGTCVIYRAGRDLDRVKFVIICK